MESTVSPAFAASMVDSPFEVPGNSKASAPATISGASWSCMNILQQDVSMDWSLRPTDPFRDSLVVSSVLAPPSSFCPWYELPIL
jgi:hypothetical protein